jgi:hypothetical protein
LDYQRQFNDPDMKNKRRASAKALIDFWAQTKSLTELDDTLKNHLDDLLDLFEDVGFLVQGGQISPEAAHHFFHYWFCGYWNSARDYIASEQHGAQWDHLEDLDDFLAEQERWSCAVADRPMEGWGAEAREKFLLEERDLP